MWTEGATPPSIGISRTIRASRSRGHLLLDIDTSLSQRISFVAGALGEDYLVFTGRQLDDNLALRKVFYTGKQNDYGFDEIVITENDTAADGTVDSVTRSIEVVVDTVNDPPTIVAPENAIARVGSSDVKIEDITFDNMEAKDPLLE